MVSKMDQIKKKNKKCREDYTEEGSGPAWTQQGILYRGNQPQGNTRNIRIPAGDWDISLAWNHRPDDSRPDEDTEKGAGQSSAGGKGCVSKGAPCERYGIPPQACRIIRLRHPGENLEVSFRSSLFEIPGQYPLCHSHGQSGFRAQAALRANFRIRSVRGPASPREPHLKCKTTCTGKHFTAGEGKKNPDHMKTRLFPAKERGLWK